VKSDFRRMAAWIAVDVLLAVVVVLHNHHQL
jgi:hypothetical protein